MIRDLTSSHKVWQIKKFAYKLKQMVSLLTGIPVEDLEKEEVKNSLLGDEWSMFGVPISIREVLQKLGTEGVRDTIHPNAWVNALFADYQGFMEKAHKGTMNYTGREESMYAHTSCLSCNKSYYGYKRQTRCKQCIEEQGAIYPNWLITDCRFPNEAQAVKERGGITLRINRPNSQVGTHASEIALDDYEFDYTIENSSNLVHLEEEVRKFLVCYNLL